MIIRMTINMSGGRYDNRDWPPAGVDFEVPDEEGAALVKDRNAIFVRQSSMEPVPRPAHELIESIASSTGAGPVSGAEEPAPSPLDKGLVTSPPSMTGTGPVWSTPSDEKVHQPAPPDEMPPQPKPSEPKRTWEDYAVANGMDADDAVDATKAELMSKYGGRL